MFEDSVQIANELLAKGDIRSCVYACLELRYAIEKHVYTKIEFYSKRYGKKQLYSSWQPNKALKILCQLEPLADQSYEFRVAAEKEPGVPGKNWISLGKHEALNSKWVAKNYNKLGSFLHRNASGEFANVDEIKAYLSEVVAEIERIEKSSMLSDFAQTARFNCSLCNEEIVCCVDGLKNSPEVVCSNMSCTATYLADDDEGRWRFIIDAVEFECPECSCKKNILKNELVIGAGWKCKKCGARYQISGHTWNYNKVKS